MCLMISHSREDRFATKRGKVVGYKVLTTNNQSPFKAGRGFQWVKGMNKSSRKSGKQGELLCITEGFHVFSDRGDAKSLYYDFTFKGCPWAKHFNDLWTKYKVVEVLVDPDDVVAYGYMEGSRKTALVCTQCYTDLEEVS